MVYCQYYFRYEQTGIQHSRWINNSYCSDKKGKYINDVETEVEVVKVTIKRESELGLPVERYKKILKVIKS